MKSVRWFFPLTALMLIFFTANGLQAQDYSATKDIFRSSPQVRWFFDNAYGYALFPVVGKGGFILGGAYGEGKVYQGGRVTGTANLIHGSIGLQIGGQAFSEIIFFQDKRAYDEFTRGQFEFGANASAVAITAGATAKASTTGTSASASAGPRSGVQSEARYVHGMATFVYVKGGLMAEIAVGGQKFNYRPL